MNATTKNAPVMSIRGSKVDRIFRVLLSREKKDLTWYMIAKHADVAYGWAHTVLKGLEEKGIIRGRKVKKPRRLFEMWSKRPDDRKYREYHVQEPEAVLRRSKLDFALTNHFAEHLMNGYLFTRYYDIYIIERDALAWHSSLVRAGYVGKGNVRVFLSDEHIFFERRTAERWPTVSVQQLIVDLIREGAECAEAADQLIERFYHD